MLFIGQKLFGYGIPLLEKHILSTGNKTIKVLGKVWRTLFQKNFSVIT